jgi:hypothetical protein
MANITGSAGSRSLTPAAPSRSRRGPANTPARQPSPRHARTGATAARQPAPAGRADSGQLTNPVINPANLPGHRGRSREHRFARGTDPVTGRDIDQHASAIAGEEVRGMPPGTAGNGSDSLAEDIDHADRSRPRTPRRTPQATRSGMFSAHRVYDFAAFCLPWSGVCSCPLPLLPILLKPILLLSSCILILLLLSITPRHWRASAADQESTSYRTSAAQATIG